MSGSGFIRVLKNGRITTLVGGGPKNNTVLALLELARVAAGENQISPRLLANFSMPALGVSNLHIGFMLFLPNGDLLFGSWSYNCVLRYRSGVLTVFAGIPYDASNKFSRPYWTPTMLSTGAVGNGGSALNATLYWPSGLAVDGSGTVFIADSYDCNVRSVSPDGVIHLVAGGGDTGVAGQCAYSGDLGPASASFLASPRGLAYSTRSGSLFFCESVSKTLRELVFRPAPSCALGFSCPFGQRLMPCTDPRTFCPANTSSDPYPVSPGFLSVSLPLLGAFDGASPAQVFVAQAVCPIGFYCGGGGGIHTPCPPGTYGRRSGQPTVGSCALCGPGTYLAEAGASNVRGSPCLPCPAGSFANASGAAACTRCLPGTVAAAGGRGSASAASCAPCPPATPFSLAGASSCLHGDNADVYVFELGMGLLMRNRDYQMGANLSDAELLRLNWAICAPIVILLATPLLLELLLRALRWRRVRSKRKRAAAAARGSIDAITNRIEEWSARVVSRIDAATEQTVRGEELVREKSGLGGAFTLVAYAIFLCFVVTTLSQFFYSNTVVTASSVPLTLYERSKFSLLQPFDLVGADAAMAATAADLAGLLPAGTLAGRGRVAGIIVSITTAGRLCGQLAGLQWLTLSGAFTNTSRFDAATGEATHTFACEECMLDDRSTLVASFDGSCASFGVAVVSVGAWGSVMVSNFAVGRASAVSAALRFSLEVVQDSVLGSVDAQGYVQGGRSVYGQFQTSVTNVSAAPYSSSAANAGAPSTVSLSLAAENNYQIVFLYSNLTIIQLISSLIGLLGTLAVGALLLKIYRITAGRLEEQRGTARHALKLTTSPLPPAAAPATAAAAVAVAVAEVAAAGACSAMQGLEARLSAAECCVHESRVRLELRVQDLEAAVARLAEAAAVAAEARPLT